MELKNLPEAVQRIHKAISDREHIVLYGDADLDGVTSAIIMKEALKNLGGEIASVYFPDREQEGYGLTETALLSLAQYAPGLLIVMDLGTSSPKEIAKAKKLGFDTIVIDHHQVLNALPNAIVINPKQEGETYPFIGFAACGLSFRVAERVLGDRITPSLRKSLVELAALGTIADMMPREQDNVELIEEGMPYIEGSWRPGLRAFFDFPKIQEYVSIEEKITHAISTLNVRDVENGMPGAYRLLTAASKEEAEALVSHLWELNRIRRDNIRAFVEEVEERVKEGAKSNDPVIVEGTKNLDYVLLGAAASQLAQKYDKPVFLYKDRGTEAIGSARAPSEYDTVAAMKSCADLFLTFGGHAPASGFRLSTDNVEECRECLKKYFKSHGANA